MTIRRLDLMGRIARFPHFLGVFLTYGADADALRKLREFTRAPSLVLHDVARGPRELTSLDGSRLRVCPAVPRSRAGQELHRRSKFHAKLVLLVGREQAAIAVGSMNLTRNSLQGGGETTAWVEIDRRSKTLDEIAEWIGDQVRAPGYGIWDSVGPMLDEIRPVKPHDHDTGAVKWRFLHNRKSSIAAQVLSRIKDKAAGFDFFGISRAERSVRVATPFLSGEEGQRSVAEFLLELDPGSVMLHTRAEAPLASFARIGDRTTLFHRSGSGEFHSKQILIEAGGRALLVIGSANFTLSGFFRSQEEGGNAECAMAIHLDPANLNRWRDWFERGWDRKDFGEAIRTQKKGDDRVENDYPERPYFPAEEGANKDITIFGYVPNAGKSIILLKDRKRAPLMQDGPDGLYKGRVPDSWVVLEREERHVKFTYKGGEYNVPSFASKDFEDAVSNARMRIYAGDPVSCAYSRELVSEKDVKNHVNSHGVETTGNITEPPVLEKFYQEWRARIRAYARLYALSKADADRLTKDIERLAGGTGLYVTTALRREFKRSFKDKPGAEKIGPRVKDVHEKLLRQVFERDAAKAGCKIENLIHRRRGLSRFG